MGRVVGLGLNGDGSAERARSYGPLVIRELVLGQPGASSAQENRVGCYERASNKPTDSKGKRPIEESDDEEYDSSSSDGSARNRKRREILGPEALGGERR